MNTPAWMNSISLGTIVVSIFVVLTVAGLVWVALRPMARSARRIDQTVQELSRDWFGQEGRPGFPAIPGVPQRLLEVEQALAELRPMVDRIAKEMRPNGGSSLRDQITQLKSTVDPMQRDITSVKAEMGSITRAVDNARTLRALAARADHPEDDERRTG